MNTNTCRQTENESLTNTLKHALICLALLGCLPAFVRCLIKMYGLLTGPDCDIIGGLMLSLFALMTMFALAHASYCEFTARSKKERVRLDSQAKAVAESPAVISRDWNITAAARDAKPAYKNSQRLPLLPVTAFARNRWLPIRACNLNPA